MTFIEKLRKRQLEVNSMVCVELDTDQDLIPVRTGWIEDPVLAFNKTIINTTAEFVCSFKINIAYYLISGRLEAGLEDTVEYIHKRYPEIPVILDIKEGDIATTAKNYVQARFNRFRVDAVTVNPFLGHNSCQPFLDQKDKRIFILCKTSNPDSKEFQDLKVFIQDSDLAVPGIGSQMKIVD